MELTAPYGHAGQFARLRDMVEHYSRSEEKLRAYDASQVDPRLAATVWAGDEILATRDRRLEGLVLTDAQLDRLVAFLTALTDPRSRSLGGVAPGGVPSGLSIDR